MPKIVVHRGSVREVQVVSVTIALLEFSQTRDEPRYYIEWSKASWADETGRASANAFDRLCPKRYLLNENTRKSEFNHYYPSRSRRGRRPRVVCCMRG